MIGSLRGTLAWCGADGDLLVEVGGVGYRVSVPARTAVALGAVGSDVFLHVHTHVREDAIVLYGFAHDDERRCFEALLGAHGVGPALALSVLSALSPAALSAAVLEDDAETLCAVPGIGRKTAARLLIDLKSRLDVPERSGADVGAGSVRAEARAALAELGYAPEEIRRALEGRREDVGVEELLKLALRELAGR
ncbi:MAG: Holliday junction branch migration protein RuvA [Actinomycetota bacterium]|nr:Holliday junction branch migration protein RuvA [Actinomycetota bacterium]